MILGGISTCSVWYLTVERIMGPLSARALGSTTPEHAVALGIKARLGVAWALATVVPLSGVVVLSIGHLAGVGFEA